MQIKPMLPVAITTLYPGVAVPAHKESGKLEQSVELSKTPLPRSRVIEGVSATANEQRRQHAQRRMNQVFADSKPTQAPRRMATPEILGELIIRMGGAGVYSGPGRLVNIAV